MSTIDQPITAGLPTQARRIRITTGNYEEHLHWDVNCPAAEWADGEERGSYHVLHELNDRAEKLDLFDALDRGSLAFVKSLHRSSFILSHVDRDVPTAGLVAYLFGAGSGGLNGRFGRAYLSAFEQLRPFIASVH